MRHPETPYPLEGVTTRNHIVQFYDTDDFLCASVCRFLLPGFTEGRPILVIATEPHRQALIRHLQGESIDVESAIRSGQLALLDAQETLSAFMDEELPDAVRFNTAIGAAFEAARAGRETLAALAYGEMVDILWQQNKARAAIRLEEL